MARPRVSFILATHNRGAIVVDCLRRTLACGLPADSFTLFVVDNASTDDTREQIQALSNHHRNLRLIPLEKNFGPVAKNFAIHDNPAEFLVLLDDDAYPLPGAVPQMLRHFREDPHLAAAVFDVTLPDGAKEASAFPDVFIGAGTGLRNAALQSLPKTTGGGYLPHDFFMQAEEYDLSFRLIAAGHSIQRFWDMPLMHLKSPGARIGQRTTRLDVRNNLYLLARYLPEPLCHQFAADWLTRYFLMAKTRDQEQPPHPTLGTHKQAFLRGAAQGLKQWAAQRAGGGLLLPDFAIERLFKLNAIQDRLARVQQKLNLRRIAFAEFGKNMLPFHRAAEAQQLEVAAILDDRLAPTFDPSSNQAQDARITEYRGLPILSHNAFTAAGLHDNLDAIIVTAISPVHAQPRAAALRRTFSIPIIDLFSRRDVLLHGSSTPTLSTT